MCTDLSVILAPSCPPLRRAAVVRAFVVNVAEHETGS